MDKEIIYALIGGMLGGILTLLINKITYHQRKRR